MSDALRIEDWIGRETVATDRIHAAPVPALTATLDRERPCAQLARFSFRALQPLIDTAPFALCGRRGDSANVSLWARDAKGCLAMQADAVPAA